MVRKWILIVIIFLFLANVLAWIVVYELSQPQLLEVSFFDVGQGDSTFIEIPFGYQVLIDGGPGTAVLGKLGVEMPFWDRNIDLLILTHPEYDHISGLIEVLKSYEVGSILWTGIVKETAEYEKWLECIGNEGAHVMIAEAGQKIKIGRAYLDILHPFEKLEGQSVKDANDTSVVVRLVFGQNSFLFTGDIYKSAEDKLVDREGLDSDVLKVSHHGSKTSSGEEFIKEVLPNIAVIQVGKDNPYNHPHPETLEILEKYDIKVLRTDLNGDIKIISDGVNYRIR